MNINLKGRRELLWDTDVLEYFQDIRVNRHSPTRRNTVVTCDGEWEAGECCYSALLKHSDEYRLYYRAKSNDEEDTGSYCLAISRDGKNFKKPILNQTEFRGSTNNNIFHREERFIDNFSVHIDTNPNCPAEEKFKALSLFIQKEPRKNELGLYVSADGTSFKFKYMLNVKGVFDTYNVLLFDEKRGKYLLYLRDFHNKDGSDAKYVPDDAVMKPCIRDVRLSLSDDLINWSTPVRLNYGDEDLLQMYTNQIIKYPRADVYLGFPTRYLDRCDDTQNFKHLSNYAGWRTSLFAEGSRIASSMTDCVVMYSKDALNFKRDENAFMSPDYEQGDTWIYGDCYLSHGLIEVDSDEYPSVKEYAFVTGHGRRSKKLTSFVRYTIRLDGFYSLRADFSGGEMLTKPMTLGDTLKINFSTSALGHVRIIVCNEDGEKINGYDSGLLFGNSTDRPVEFEKPLSLLSEKAVRLKFIMKDADLYSICSDM